MKTKIFKLVLPLVMLAAGLMGAVSTHAAETENGVAAADWGTLKTGTPQRCEAVKLCDEMSSNICTYQGQPLYKHLGNNVCPNFIYHSIPE